MCSSDLVSNIRLLDIANRIIGKYRGLCGDGRIFPVPHGETFRQGEHFGQKQPVADGDVTVPVDDGVLRDGCLLYTSRCV